MSVCNHVYNTVGIYLYWIWIFQCCKMMFASTVELCPTKWVCIVTWYGVIDFLQNLHLAFFYSNVSHQIYQCSLIKIQDTFVASLEKQTKAAKCNRWRSRCSLCRQGVLVCGEQCSLWLPSIQCSCSLRWWKPTAVWLLFYLKILGIREWAAAVQSRSHLYLWMNGPQQDGLRE